MAVDPDASWHLVTSRDLDAPFTGKFLLQINERDTELVRAVRRAGDDPVDRARIDEMYTGVAMVMIRTAVAADDDRELSDRADWPEESVGQVLSDLLRRCGLRSDEILAADPGDAEAMLQGAVRRAGIGRAFT